MKVRTRRDIGKWSIVRYDNSCYSLGLIVSVWPDDPWVDVYDPINRTVERVSKSQIVYIGDRLVIPDEIGGHHEN